MLNILCWHDKLKKDTKAKDIRIKHTEDKNTKQKDTKKVTYTEAAKNRKTGGTGADGKLFESFGKIL